MDSLLHQKSQEISFALIRIAAYVRRFGLRKKVEELSYHLIDNIAYRNYDLALDTIAALRSFLELGLNVYEIELVNYQILVRELSVLENEIRERSGEFPLQDFEDIFTKVESVQEKASRPLLYGRGVKKEEVQYTEERKKEVTKKESQGASGNKQKARSTEPSQSARERQEKILQILKEKEEKAVQLKELTDVFPEVSGRTLRYDLKNLKGNGKIVHSGRGPASVYMLPERSPYTEVN